MTKHSTGQQTGIQAGEYSCMGRLLTFWFFTSKLWRILNGTDSKSNEEVLELAEKHENVYAALGYFYTFADEIRDEDIDLLDKQLNNEMGKIFE